MASKLPELRKAVALHNTKLQESLERLDQLSSAAHLLGLTEVAKHIDTEITAIKVSLMSLNNATK